MKLLKLRIGHFGKFHNAEYTFRDGLNVIYGENEAGKSTIHSFIYAMLFGIDKPRGKAARDNIYVRYQPWDTPGAYQGSMDFEHQGREYRITRVFYQKEKSCTLTELSTGHEIKLADGRITGLIPELTESAYKNTISAGQQRIRTDAALAEEVRNHIANLATAKAREIDVAGATDRLNLRRKEIQSELKNYDCDGLEAEIALLLEKEEEQNGYMAEYEVLCSETKELERQRMELVEGSDYLNAERYRNIPALTERFQRLEDINSECDDVRARIKHRREKAEELREGTDRLEPLKAALASIEADSEQETEELTEIRAGAEKEYEALEEEYKRKLSDLQGAAQTVPEGQESGAENQGMLDKKIKSFGTYGFAMTVVGCILGIISNNRWQTGIFIAVILLLAGIITLMSRYIYVREKRRLESKQQERTRQQLASAEHYKRMTVEYSDSLERQKSDIDTGREQKLKECSERHDRFKREIINGLHAESAEEMAEELRSLQNNVLKLEQLNEQIREYEQDVQRREADLNRIKTELEAELSEFSELFGAEVLSKEGLSELYASQKEKAARLIEREHCLSEELSVRKSRISRLEWSIDKTGDIGALLYERREALNERREKAEHARRDLAAVELAISTINDISAEIHDSFGTEFNKVLSGIVYTVTKGQYKEARVNKELHMEVMSDIDFVSADALSTGTTEQLYMALRMAVAQLFFGEQSMPLLFDDCFAYYDDKRLAECLGELLYGYIRTGEDGKQILLFTCHKRERELLSGLGIDYNYICMT